MSNTKQQIVEDIWCGALDAKEMKREFQAVSDYETAYIKYKTRVAEKAVEAIDRLVTEARMNELEMLPHKVFDCSPLIHLGYTFDEHTDRIAELQSQLNEEQK